MFEDKKIRKILKLDCLVFRQFVECYKLYKKVANSNKKIKYTKYNC